ncbi:TPA: hypothetical protein ACUK1F_005153, partial [Escherichia coli]
TEDETLLVGVLYTFLATAEPLTNALTSISLPVSWNSMLSVCKIFSTVCSSVGFNLNIPR